MKRFLVLLIMAVFLSGCADPKIDVSTEELSKKSVEKVRNSLPEAKRAEFDNAMQAIIMSAAFSKINFADIMAGKKPEEPTSKDALKILQPIHGKTGEQVIAEGNRIKEEYAAKEKERVAKRLAEDREKAAKDREDVLAKIKDLESKKALVEASKAELVKFRIISARFYKKDKKFMDRIIGKEPAIDLNVKNETSHPVSRAYFIGTLSSPGRSVPWLREDFNYSILGGLEKGEEAVWKLAPNPYGKWGTGTIDAPENAVLTVETVRLDGADGKALFDSKGFSDLEEEILGKRKAELAKIDALLQGAKK